MNKCLCGCGVSVKNRFVTGHWLRVIDQTGDKNNQSKKKGDKSRQWKGGIRKNREGYISVYKPEHPFCDINKCVKQHRLIYENYVSIVLDEHVFIPKGYDIHHINGIKDDNRLINLELLSSSEHTILHNKVDTSNRVCLLCGSDKTRVNKKGIKHWSKYKDGYICDKCYSAQYRRR